MEPFPNWEKVRRKFVSPSGLSSLIAKLLSQLPVPRQARFGWELTQHQLLLPDGLETHFKGQLPLVFLGMSVHSWDVGVWEWFHLKSMYGLQDSWFSRFNEQ